MNNVNRAGGSKIAVRTMTKVSVLSVIAFILMYIEVPLTFIAPNFIQMDISDVPALIGGFSMGPMYGVLIQLIKNVMHILLKGTTTGGVGELSNFIISAAFVASASVIYLRKKTYKRAVIGLLVGVLTMTLVSTISNYFVVFPLYSKFIPMDAIIAMGNAITPRIHDLWTLMLYSMVPFNLFKGLCVSIVTMLIYKKVSPILHR